MSIGNIWLRLKLKYQHGLRVAYYRDVARDKILRTPPVAGTNDALCEIHALTCDKDWLNLMWALKSFYYYSKRHYALCIHDDGSLSKKQITAIRWHFPEARIVDRRSADSLLIMRLKSRPLSLAFRKSNLFALKLFDFFEYLSSDRMLVMDSDILFFDEPKTLLRNIEDKSYTLNCLNKDWAYGYSIDLNEAGFVLPFKIHNLINAGLGLIHRSSFDYGHIEDYLKLPAIMSHKDRIEQTLVALYSSRHGVELLPEEYDVHLGRLNPASPCRHYTGPIRHKFYGEGIKRLIRNNGIFKELDKDRGNLCA